MNLAELSIRRPIFITCVFFLILAVGALSLMRTPVDLFPDITFPVVTVTTPYPGAGPREVETLVSKIVEDEVSTISGVKTVRSINKEGVSTVVVEFTLNTDIKYAEQQVRDRVSSARRKLPDEIEETTIRRIDPADQPVLTVGLTAAISPSELFDLGSEVIRPKLQQVDQVGLVEVLGGRKREVQIQLDQDKLREYQISASTVSQRIGEAGENVPAGKVSENQSELVYRTLAEFTSLKDIESAIVSFFANERPIRVKELGRVVDTLEDEKSRVFLNGEKSMILQVFRQSGSNTVAVVDAVKKKIDQINREFKTDSRNIKLSVIRDNSRIIHNNVADVEEAIIIGIILTVLVVLYFLGSVRSTFITGMALPNSLLGAFILMAWAGFTVNIMTLLALSLAVGLLIDDAIVVRENIFRHLEMGKSPRKAAIEGTNEVAMAVIATTMTVIAVFGPIGFLQGVVGQFFKQFGLTVCFAMLISLFDALTMAPMLSAYFAGSLHHGHAKSSDEANPKGFFSKLWNKTIQRSIAAFDRFQSRMENIFEAFLGNFVLVHPLKVLLGGVLIFAVSVVALRFVPKTFLPPQDNGEFTIRLETPPGTSIDGMNEIANKIDLVIRSNKEVQNSLLLIGSRDAEANVASIFVQLVGSKQRLINTSQMKDKVREQLKEFSFAKPIVSDVDAVGSGQRPFTVNINGSDLEALEEYSRKIFELVKNHSGLKDVELGSKPGKPEFQFVIDPEKAESLGVSTKTAGFELRTLVEGTVPAVFRSQGLEYDIRVRSMEHQRELKNRKEKVLVPNINGKLVQISRIATPTEKTGPAVINRENRNRYVSISADIAPNGPGMGGAIDDFRKIFKENPPPQGIGYSFVGQAENFQELIVNMLVAMGLGILFIYLVLASLYESFVTPFIIMLVLPLALCGAFFALLFTGKSLDLFSMIGCVLLLGVATKNSILLVDYANQMKLQGMDRAKAIVLAGKTRLRPILMTSFALIAGMLPVAIGLNEASKQRTSMGIAIIGGLISSTFLTLLIVPAAFSYIDRFGSWLNNKFRSMIGGAGEEAQQ